MGTQNTAFNVSQISLLGTTCQANTVNLSTSGTCTLTATCSFASNTLGGASCSVSAAALMATNNGSTNMLAGQTFASSAWNTNQNFNLTYAIYFAT
jgi:hypothetical protein